MPIVIGLLLVAPYWLGPVMIWLTNRSRVPQWDVPGGGGLEPLPKQLRPFFDATDRALVDLRFSLVSVLRQEGLAPGYATWVALYVNRPLQERAVVHAHIATNPELPPGPKPAVYFVTRWTDGRLIETANGSHVSPFPDIPGKESRQFPEVSNPTVLYKIHQLRSAVGGRTPRAFPAEGAEVDGLTQAMAEFYQLHVGTGYLSPLEPGLFRPTPKGALFMTWRLLPPLTWIARWKRKRQNAAFLSKHNLPAGPTPL